MDRCKTMLLAVAAFFLGCAVQPAQAGAPFAVDAGVQTVEPDYYLAFRPSMPSPGQELTVFLASRTALPAGTTIRWNLSGAPFSNAGVKDPKVIEYSFTPSGPGSYAVTAEFHDAQGRLFGSSTLEIVIGGGFSSQHEALVSQPAPDMYLGISPAQPRIGQPVSFTFNYGSALPAGSEVRWAASGGPISGEAVGGVNKETYTFTPSGQGPFMIQARLLNAQAILIGEVSLGFIPVP